MVNVTLQGFCLGEVRALIWQRKETRVSQVNVTPPEPRPTGSQVNVNQPEPGPWPSRDENTSTIVTRNLTWALAMVIVVAVIAVALVYVLHGL